MRRFLPATSSPTVRPVIKLVQHTPGNLILNFRAKAPNVESRLIESETLEVVIIGIGVIWPRDMIAGVVPHT